MFDLISMENRTVTVSEEDLAGLRAQLAGDAILPGDAGYDAARKVWNALIDRRPGLIVQCKGLADVLAAVRFARTHALLVAVRCGGHNVSGSAVCDGGMVIDLRRMRAVMVSADRESVFVEGGALLRDIDRETQVFGRVTPTGNVSETGIGGLSLGGGMGNLRRRFGLSVDNLLSVQIVTADGSVHTASASENPDLFWAVRGGGGNFGIVTRFEFRLHALGPDVAFAAQFFPIEQAEDLLARWRDTVEAAPDDVSSLAFFWTIPDMDGFPAEIRGHQVFLYAAMYAGPADEGEAHLAGLKSLGEPILDLSGVGPYTAWQQAFDPFFADGQAHDRIYAYWKSLYLSDLNDAVIADIAARARTFPAPECLVALWHLGGAVARVPEADTAFGKRTAPYLLSFDSCWTDPALSDRVTEWTRAQVQTMEAYSPGGSYLNFPGVGTADPEAVKAAYGANFSRLSRIKMQYDPDNLFRLNQNIPPRAAG